MSKTSRREKGKNVYFFFLMFRWHKKNKVKKSIKRKNVEKGKMCFHAHIWKKILKN